jgi:hypothetical protein
MNANTGLGSGQRKADEPAAAVREDEPLVATPFAVAALRICGRRPR